MLPTVDKSLEKWGLKSVRPSTLSLRGDPPLVLHFRYLIKHPDKGCGVSCYQMRYFYNNTDDNSLDKDIPDADSKKIIQHHFKLKKDMRGEYMSYVWRM